PLSNKGATMEAPATSYQGRAIDMALTNGHTEAATLLLTRGSKGGASGLNSGITAKNVALVKAAIGAPDITRANLTSSLALAKRVGDADILKLVTDKLDAMRAAAATPAVTCGP